MKKVLTYKGAVMTWECDSNGHMNVMYYINKFENAGRNFGLEMGIAEYMAENKKVGFVVLEQTIQYIQEVFEDDLLYIESHLEGFSNKAFTMKHEMYNGSTRALVSTMKAVGVLFDKELRKAMVIPEDKRVSLTQLMEG